MPRRGEDFMRAALRSATAALIVGTLGCRSGPDPESDQAARWGRSANAEVGPKTITGPQPSPSEPMAELTPDRAFATHVDLGRIFESRGQWVTAETEYRAALEIDGAKIDDARMASAHRRMAAVLDRQGKFADSEPHHRAAMRLAPDDPKVWNNAGYSAYLQGRWPEAIDRLGKAVSLDPDDPRALTNLGLSLAAAGRVDQALETLTQAGGPASAHANLGYILAASGRTEEAKQHYDLALRTGRDLPVARQALARLDQGATPSDGAAEALADRSRRTDPRVIPATATGATSRERSGEDRVALPPLPAPSSDPSSP